MGNFITVLTVTFVVYFILALAVFDVESIGDRKLIPEGNLQVRALRDAVELVTVGDMYMLGVVLTYAMRSNWSCSGVWDMNVVCHVSRSTPDFRVTFPVCRLALLYPTPYGTPLVGSQPPFFSSIVLRKREHISARVPASI